MRMKYVAPTLNKRNYEQPACQNTTEMVMR